MIRQIWLRARGDRSELPAALKLLRHDLENAGFVVTDEVNDHTDLCICLGGDGALLASVRDLGARRFVLPILGIHSSRGLGFLHPLQIPWRADALPAWTQAITELLKTERYSLEERWGLEISVSGADADGPLAAPLWALNDIVIGKGPLSRMLSVSVSVDGQIYVKKIRGDGLIVSSATGSTAYSLSAGGPILHPSLKAMLLTPICPHDVSLRPLVLGADVQIEIEILADSAAAFLTCDGQSGFELRTGQKLQVRKAADRVKWLMPRSDTLQAKGYFETLRSKLGFGRKDERGNEDAL